MSIEVNNLTKVYGAQKALNAISFKINKGEIAGFLGPNGAGKSTTMKILTGFIPPTSGTVIINGYDITTHKKKVQESIGYLPEHNPQYADMYVREFLEFNAEIYHTNKTYIEGIIDATGLSPEAHKKTGRLSKGYRQRVGLAAALLHNPEVLILDEPTTGLDPNQLVAIRELIKSIGKEKTILLSTHILQEVEAVCDRVLIINKGELAADTQMATLQNHTVQIIVVEFDYRVEEAFLEQLPHIETIRNINGFIYELAFSVKRDMRTTVFDLAHDNGLKILQLKQQHTSLERLFKKLTAT